RHQENGPVPLIGADGVVCSTSRSHLIDNREALLMNSVRYASIYKEASRHLQTTPAAPANEASRHLLDGRSHPSLTKEGSSPDPDGVGKRTRIIHSRVLSPGVQKDGRPAGQRRQSGGIQS